MILFDLQFFADGGGALTNTTEGYVNSYTGVAVATGAMSPSMKTYYDTELLENVRPNMIYAQLGDKQPLPRNHGKTVEWRKWNTLPNADVLVEGVIPTGKQLGQTVVTQAITQHGQYVTVSDQLDLHAIDNVILGATEELSASAAETQDNLIRAELLSNPVIQFAAGRTSLATITTSDVVTPTEINKAVTALKKMKAPMINGKYVAVIHPSVAYDLRQNSDWIDAHKYSATTEIFNGEIGELHGVRFLETTQAPVIKGDNLAGSTRSLAVNGAVTASASVTFDGGTVAAGALVGRFVEIAATGGNVIRKILANTATVMTLDAPVTAANDAVINPLGSGTNNANCVYATQFFAKGAFKIIDPDGAGMEMIIHPRGEAGGPLDQFSTIGYKFSQAAKIVYNDRMVTLLSGSSYGATDTANVTL